MTNGSSGSNDEATRGALEIARNSDDGDIDPRVLAILEEAIQAIWLRIQAQPQTYVLTKLEFAVFNYFQDRFRGNSTAQRAVERFWNHFQSDASDIDRYTF